MKKVRTPKNLDQATALLNQFAEVDGKLAAVEAARQTDLGVINAAADLEAAPLVEELSAISAAIEPWWLDQGQKLLPKKRKTMVLAGCDIGTKVSSAKLVHGFASDADAAAALRAARQGKQTVRVKYELDKAGTTTLLKAGGKRAAKIRELGLAIDAGAEQFFVKRAEQAGTIGVQG